MFVNEEPLTGESYPKMLRGNHSSCESGQAGAQGLTREKQSGFFKQFARRGIPF